jgi:hypothetical protein
MSFGDTPRRFSDWSLGGSDLVLDDFDRIGSHVSLLVDLQSAGRFLMDDFYRAGGCSQSCGRCAISSTRRPSRHWALTRRLPGRRSHLGP